MPRFLWKRLQKAVGWFSSSFGASIGEGRPREAPEANEMLEVFQKPHICCGVTVGIGDMQLLRGYWVDRRDAKGERISRALGLFCL